MRVWPALNEAAVLFWKGSRFYKSTLSLSERITPGVECVPSRDMRRHLIRNRWLGRCLADLYSSNACMENIPGVCTCTEEPSPPSLYNHLHYISSAASPSVIEVCSAGVSIFGHVTIALLPCDNIKSSVNGHRKLLYFTFPSSSLTPSSTC